MASSPTGSAPSPSTGPSAPTSATASTATSAAKTPSPRTPANREADEHRPTELALPAHAHEATSPGPLVVTTPRSEPELKIVAGRYQIKRPIGEGSMGRIFLAEQVSVGRRVALKIINRELSTKYDTIARFQQEARLLGSVHNEHIVDIYDIGETEAGDPFIAMEFVDGPSLLQVVREGGPMPAERAIRLMLQIASALAAVHEAGVVHRDLKPANIVLLRVPGDGELVKILDFGLAKVLSDREPSGRLTRAGSIVGTPEYMSPEQVTGGPVDHRADIYGFGCTAYEMLAGQPPFLGAEVATLYKHMHEQVPRLDKRRADVPAGLAQLVHRCLEKQPKDRFGDMRAVHAALLDAADRAGIARATLVAPRPRGGFDAEPQPASPSVTGAQALPRARSRLAALVTATALVVGLVGGVLLDRVVRPSGDDAAGAGSSGGDGQAMTPAPGRGVLLVTTLPPGVDVSVGGSPPGTSPLVVRDLAPGRHEVAVSGRGWVSKQATVEIVPGRLTELSVSLERPRYTVRIVSEPSGAAVMLDGKEIGVTPLDTSLTELEFHELNLRRDGYRDRDVYIAPDSKDDILRVVMQPVLLNAGSIIINSDYPGKVFIDGQDTGEWTPTGEIQLMPGRHTIELVDNMNVRRKLTVTITRNQLVTLDVPAPKAAP